MSFQYRAGTASARLRANIGEPLWAPLVAPGRDTFSGHLAGQVAGHLPSSAQPAGELRHAPAALVFLSGRMPVLFALSILAFVALVWATISIVKFVRHARQRRRSRASAARKADSLDPLTTGANVASGAAFFPPPPPSPSPAPPPRLRHFPTRLGRQNVTSPESALGHAAWNPFAKQLDVVTDPTPARRPGVETGQAGGSGNGTAAGKRPT